MSQQMVNWSKPQNKQYTHLWLEVPSFPEAENASISRCPVQTVRLLRLILDWASRDIPTISVYSGREKMAKKDMGRISILWRMVLETENIKLEKRKTWIWIWGWVMYLYKFFFFFNVDEAVTVFHSRETENGAQHTGETQWIS